MSVGLAGILARARTVIAALTPTTATAPGSTFTQIGVDLGVEHESPAQNRTFEVRLTPGEGPKLTRAVAGATVGQLDGGFEVVVRYDAASDLVTAEALALEDAEQIVWALEMDTNYPSGTREVTHTGTTFDGGRQFRQLVLTYRATYERTF